MLKVETALTEAFKYSSYFISFNDLTRFILLKLEEHVRLNQQEKDFLYQELRRIYEKTQADTLRDFPIKPKFNIADQRAIEYALKLNDFYLGKFFQGDKQLRLDIVKWLSKYYLEEGNPIGKGQAGIKEFLDKFGDYLKQRTESKARQIIDTSVNHLRNSARLQAMAKAQVKRYRWDAVGDRLTCPYCRSMDGRIFDTGEAIRTLQLIETDPSVLPQVKPFLTTMPLEKLKTTKSHILPSKFPPAHPHCRCRVVAYIEELKEEYPVVIEEVHATNQALLDQLKAELEVLTKEEISQRIKAHLGSDWRRMSGGRWDEGKEHLLEHIEKHARKLNLTPEQYERLPYEVIKKPDKVYIQKTQVGKRVETDYIFVKDRIVVVSSDDWLGIKTCFLLHKKYNDYVDKVKDDERRISATVRIL